MTDEQRRRRNATNLEYMRRWRLANLETSRARTRKSHSIHKDERNARHRVRYASDPEMRATARARVKAWRKANPDKVKLTKKVSVRRQRIKEIERRMLLFQGQDCKHITLKEDPLWLARQSLIVTQALLRNPTLLEVLRSQRRESKPQTISQTT